MRLIGPLNDRPSLSLTVKLRDSSLVLWHTFGLTHNPRTEDWPVVRRPSKLVLLLLCYHTDRERTSPSRRRCLPKRTWSLSSRQTFSSALPTSTSQGQSTSVPGFSSNDSPPTPDIPTNCSLSHLAAGQTKASTGLSLLLRRGMGFREAQKSSKSRRSRHAVRRSSARGVKICQSTFAPLVFSTTTMLPSSSMRFSLHPDPFATSRRGRSCTYMSRRSPRRDAPSPEV